MSVKPGQLEKVFADGPTHYKTIEEFMSLDAGDPRSIYRKDKMSIRGRWFDEKRAERRC